MKKKYNFLKSLVRIFTSKKWRANKRSIFFENLFLNCSEQKITKETGAILDGLINYESTSFGNTCDDLARHYPFYPFDLIFSMDMTNYLMRYCNQNFISLKVNIIRECSIWKLLSGKGKFKVRIVWEDLNNTIHEKSYDAIVTV